MQTTYGDVGVSLNDHVAVVEIQRPPHNFFDHMLIKDLADAFDDLDENPDCRALVTGATDVSSWARGGQLCFP
jgi:enoyl-CoA hydratase/carnithine racemase